MEHLEILGWNGHTKLLSKDIVDHLKQSIEGEVLMHGDSSYDQARLVWNGMIDRNPSLIIQCKSSTDIQSAVKFARENELMLTIKGGGHHVAGSAVRDLTLMVDLSMMNDVEMDNNTVKVQGGATWGDVDQVTQQKGLAVPGGVVSTTGIAGLTMGGGIGWLRRKYGLACDNLLSAEVITANGDLITASERSHPDLFWAIRGGGGGFGIVSSFQFRMHPVGPEVMFCAVFYPADLTEKLLKQYRQFSESLPAEISTFLIYGSVPGEEPFPKNRHGDDFILIASMYSGDFAEGERILQPFRQIGEPIADFSGPMPYAEVQQFFDEDYPKHELHYYWKSLFCDNLTDEVIRKFITLGKNRPSPLTTVDIWHLGGAIDNLSKSDTAYPQRGTKHLLAVESNWESGSSDATNIEWTRKAIAELSSVSGGSPYLNFEDAHDDNVDRARGEHREKLSEIKRKYDPQGMFS